LCEYAFLYGLNAIKLSTKLLKLPKHLPYRMRYFISTVCLILLSSLLWAQNIPIQLEWETEIEPPKFKENTRQLTRPVWCTNCKETIAQQHILPVWQHRISIGQAAIGSVKLENIITLETDKEIDGITNNTFEVDYHYTTEAGQTFVTFVVNPLRLGTRQVEMLVSANLIYTLENQTPSRRLKNKKDQTYTSVLATGDIYKISVPSAGVYKIDANFLSSNGIDVSNINLNTFKIYGNGGYMLPEIIAEDRPEDLLENPLLAQDFNGNNMLDGNDYILWYSPGHDKFYYDSSSSIYRAASHDFDENSYYYLTWGGGAGKRIQTLPSGEALNATNTLTSYDYLIFHENDEENLIKSGRQWWGDNMQTERTKRFTYNIPGLVTDNAQFTSVTGVRSLIGESITITAAASDPFTINHNPVSGQYDDPFISGPKNTTREISINSSEVNVEFRFNKSQFESAAWIDYFLIAAKRELGAYTEPQHFRFGTTAIQGVNQVLFNTELSPNVAIWKVDDLQNVAAQSTFTQAGNSSFKVNLQQPHNATYITFDRTACPSPQFIEKITNQNLHGIVNTDYIIVTHPSLLSEAERLAEFHRDFNKLTVNVVTTTQVFNEFSSGSQDVTAIRDFAKLLYDRGINEGKPLKHLLLFGDASYDYKDQEENNTNLVPIYQSYNSYDPPFSYCSDDYYAILDDNEGYWGINSRDEGLDIGVGRLPVSNLAEATIVVDKILHYHTEASLGDWIKRLTFVGDDEDLNSHVGPSETITDLIQTQRPSYNINKIWLDAYEQVSFGSGNRYPQANTDINKAINSQGTLIFNYVGHGGENGMAHEQVVTRPQIESWSNEDHLSFYITASCELAKIDNLEIESPGELMLLDPDGGAIGLVATTRVVYIGANTDLNIEIMNNNMFKQVDGQLQTLGDIYKNTRNAAIEEINKRCFMLLADPAMRLLHPTYQVVTTKINGQEIGLFNDTLSALDLVTIEGEIRDTENNLMPGFNGTLSPTFYDKSTTYKTLGNDPGSIPIEFEMQDRVIYKGRVSVDAGKFRFQFVVPKDIAYNIADGKLSYFAKDGLDYAGGAELNYKVGGTSSNIQEDNTPPTISLFMDDRSWNLGGTTNTTPLLIADLFDENGINTIGSGIGREMVAILDEGTDYEETLILNDFYQPKLNSYQEGVIEFPFDNLSEGPHTLTVKVWDVYNNSAEDYTEFTVVNDEDLVVNNLLNYPNPFNKFTTFHFDHNKAGQRLNAVLTIKTVAGNVVKTIASDLWNASSHSSDLTWDGTDNFGDNLARGVYLYTLKLEAEDGTTSTTTEKLYIIN
jgi:hypothetical protein